MTLVHRIRGLQEYRNWKDRVKDHYGNKCCQCGNDKNLSTHHKPSLSYLLAKFNIKNTEDALNCVHIWDTSLGECLCELHHLKQHEPISTIRKIMRRRKLKNKQNNRKSLRNT